MHLHRGVESRYPFLTQLPSLMSLATLPIAFYQHEESTAQLDPTRHAHLCPHTVPQSVNPFAGYHTMLASQYNANVFVTTVMLGSVITVVFYQTVTAAETNSFSFSPLNTMRSLPGIAQSHILRPISLIVCILDCAALICALVLRLRLFLLQRRGRAEHFGEVCASPPSPTFPACHAVPRSF
ncbi:hypothetical protein BC835DRAFT_197584 [Cytidiella melzeri]|nr:hypothetical protein BC835DRAFT_197584 [Cytidiella melzeri]